MIWLFNFFFLFLQCNNKNNNMSTPSRIILKIRKEDIGKTIKFDVNKLPTPLGDWAMRDHEGVIYRDDTTNDFSKKVTLKGEYIAIYCHWDGYPSDVGKTLRKYYNDYETALNMIAGGWCSAISCEHIIRYANRKNESWKIIKPLQGSLDTLRKSIYGQYEYTFEDGKWKTKKCY